MNYASLNKTQRRCIDAFIKLDPSLENTPVISRKQVEELWKTLYESRKTGGEKIGYPMWLVKGKKQSRGVYYFPCPGLSAQEMTKVVSNDNPRKVEMTSEDEEFFAEIAAAGLLEEVA